MMLRAKGFLPGPLLPADFSALCPLEIPKYAKFILTGRRFWFYGSRSYPIAREHILVDLLKMSSYYQYITENKYGNILQK